MPEREEREEGADSAAAEGPEDPPPSPPQNTAGIDDLYDAVRRALDNIDPDRWGFAIGPYVRAAARLRARHGAAEAAAVLVEDIPDVMDRIAAASDVAVILARAGQAGPARHRSGR